MLDRRGYCLRAILVDHDLRSAAERSDEISLPIERIAVRKPFHYRFAQSAASSCSKYAAYLSRAAAFSFGK